MVERRCSIKLQLEENRLNSFTLLTWVLEGVVDIHRRLNDVERKQEDILSNQDTINALVTQLQAVDTDLAAEISGLQAQVAAGVQPEQLDFSGLNAVAASLVALETPAPVVDPTPAPVVDPSAPATS